MKSLSLLLLLLLSLSEMSFAQAAPALTKSDLKNEVGVVYTEEFSASPIKLLVIKPGIVYATKKGGRQLGQLKLDTKAELVGFTERAYKIRGTADHGGVSGWVTPKAFASKDPKFVENLKNIHARTLQVRELIAAKEVAIGMTTAEVTASLGEPTKTSARATKTGQSGKWEFIEYDEVKHYNTLRNPHTGATYRQYSHTTQEIKHQVAVEFENNIVTAVESSTAKNSRPRIVTSPFLYLW